MENRDILKIAAGSLIALFLISILLGFFGIGYGMMGGMMLGMGIFWILLIAVPIILIVNFVSNSDSKNGSGEESGPQERHDLAMEDLRSRYAKGEISRDSFFEIKRDLERESSSS